MYDMWPTIFSVKLFFNWSSHAIVGCSMGIGHLNVSWLSHNSVLYCLISECGRTRGWSGTVHRQVLCTASYYMANTLPQRHTSYAKRVTKQNLPYLQFRIDKSSVVMGIVLSFRRQNAPQRLATKFPIDQPTVKSKFASFSVARTSSMCVYTVTHSWTHQ